MSKDDKILADLIAGGLIGAALGALISKNSKGAGLGAIAGAALWASYRAEQRAKALNMPILIEENDKLFEIHPDGRKVFIKDVVKSNKTIQKRFILD